MRHFSQIYMSKKAILILLSLLSLLSFVLVSNLTLFLPLLSTFSMKLYSYSCQRNYIFLLFNGILVFLIKNSIFITNSSSLITDNTFPDVDTIKSNPVEKILVVDSSSVSYRIKNKRVKKTREINLMVHKSSQVNPEVHTQPGGGKEERQWKPNEVLFFIADGESEEQTRQVLDTQKVGRDNCVGGEDEAREELNKRCEEFIRKMKQDMKYSLLDN